MPSPAFEDPITAMYVYSRNPGHVVQVVRKTVSFLQGEIISIRVVREVNELIRKVSPEIVSCIDKTMAGYVIWDLIRYAIEYYRVYGLYHYNVDIYDSEIILDDHKATLKSNELFKKSITTLPCRYIGEIAKVYKTQNIKKALLIRHETNDVRINKNYSKIQSPIKQLESKKGRKEDHFVKSLTIEDEPVKDYEKYVDEKFREFLIEKIKDKKIDQQSLEQQKSELIQEFNNFIAKKDNEKISQLWNEDNFCQETISVCSKFSL